MWSFDIAKNLLITSLIKMPTLILNLMMKRVIKIGMLELKLGI